MTKMRIIKLPLIFIAALFPQLGYAQKLKQIFLSQIFADSGLEIELGIVKFVSITRFKAKNITIKHKVLQIIIETVEVKVQLKNLLKPFELIDVLLVNHMKVQFLTDVETAKNNAKTSVITNPLSLLGQLYRIPFQKVITILNKFPKSVIFNQIDVCMQIRGIDFQLSILDYLFSKKEFSFSISDGINAPIMILGKCLFPTSDCLEIVVESGDAFYIPHLEQISSYKLSANKLFLNFTFEMTTLAKSIAFNGCVSNLQIQNKIYKTEIFEVGVISIDAGFLLRPGYLSLTDGSSILFDQLKVDLDFEYDLDKNAVYFGAIADDQDINVFLNAIPLNKFKKDPVLSGTGKFDFWFSFNFKINNPLQYKIDGNFETMDLDLSVPPQYNLTYLNYPFTHVIRKENPLLEMEIKLGSGSLSFTSLADIPTNLINVLISTEDPDFFSHFGIDLKFIGIALATNLTAKSFKRGGSTITMQLARNLFLHHRKTIFRKGEEIVIAWAIENVFKISKHRILEIYLNIIELGIGIFGIKDAAAYYFNKDPKQLSLKECITLTYIIPRPKFFADAVKNNSTILKINLKRHLDLFSSMLVQKGLVPAEEAFEISNHVIFSNELGVLEL